MNNSDLSPEQLAEHIVVNSIALINADLKLKVASQRSDELCQRSDELRQRSDGLQRQSEKKQAAVKRDAHIFWLLMTASAVILIYGCYLFHSF